MSDEAKIEAAAPATGFERGPQRKQYVVPTLRRLGSVRDLTLGSPSGCAMESKGFLMAM